MRGLVEEKAGKAVLWQRVVLATIIIPVITGTVFPQAAVATSCTIGDTSKGGWARIPAPPNQNPAGSYPCSFPGPPAPDSPWPCSWDDGSNGTCLPGQPPTPIHRGNRFPYRIEGGYRLYVVVGGVGNVWEGSTTVPPAQPVCITGLVEAAAPVACAAAHLAAVQDISCPGACRLISSTVCECRWACYDYTAYYRVFETVSLQEEWVWTNKDCATEPFPAPNNTPNPDPGKPECNDKGL